MSGGERGRVNLALTLRQGGNLLLLDEPANDLDVETLGSLEHALLEFPGCAVITSHDRWFLDRIATHILAWEGGSNWFWFEGNFESYEKNKIERLGAEAARPHARHLPQTDPLTAGKKIDLNFNRGLNPGKERIMTGAFAQDQSSPPPIPATAADVVQQALTHESNRTTMWPRPPT